MATGVTFTVDLFVPLGPLCANSAQAHWLSTGGYSRAKHDTSTAGFTTLAYCSMSHKSFSQFKTLIVGQTIVEGR